MDRISMLPDELLVIILSHLTSKEATACSILSRRWRYLWTFTKRLNLDGTKSLTKFNKLLGEERPNYEKWVNQVIKVDKRPTYTKWVNLVIEDELRPNFVKWVNHVIALREASPLHEFKLSFYMTRSHETQVHEWIRYALEREAHTLELNLSSMGSLPMNYGQLCSFPDGILQQGSCSSSIHLMQLRRVTLEAVNVSGEDLEFFLCNCPLLEGLSVCKSGELVTLRVIGPFPSLKLLEIRWCDNLQSVKIRDVNLVCFKYSGLGREVKFVVENAPLLVDLSVAVWSRYLKDFLFQLRGFLRQLETLNIKISYWGSSFLLKFLNLKQLVVTYLPRYVNELLSVTCLIRAAPRLEKFVLKAEVDGDCGPRWDHQMGKKNLYENLKEVEFVGYGGVESEFELLVHLVDNAAKLQKITIHPRKIDRRDYTNLIYEKKIKARARAHQLLKAELPSPIIFEIL